MKQAFRKVGQPRQGDEHKAADTEQQRQQQSGELPAGCLVEGQKERLRKLADLPQLAHQSGGRCDGGGGHAPILTSQALTGWPGQRPATDHMNVEVEDGLTRLSTAVDHGAPIG